MVISSILIVPNQFRGSCGMTLWVIFDIDTEFDFIRIATSTSYKEKVAQFNPGIENGVPWFLDLIKENKIKATFHIQEQSNKEISFINKYSNLVKDILDNNCEVGLHVHMNKTDRNYRKTELSVAKSRLDQIIDVVSFR